jgi:hypothetical protein
MGEVLVLALTAFGVLCGLLLFAALACHQIRQFARVKAAVAAAAPTTAPTRIDPTTDANRRPPTTPGTLPAMTGQQLPAGGTQRTRERSAAVLAVPKARVSRKTRPVKGPVRVH